MASHRMDINNHSTWQSVCATFCHGPSQLPFPTNHERLIAAKIKHYHSSRHTELSAENCCCTVLPMYKAQVPLSYSDTWTLLKLHGLFVLSTGEHRSWDAVMDQWLGAHRRPGFFFMVTCYPGCWLWPHSDNVHIPSIASREFAFVWRSLIVNAYK